ncbi:hypothetical protein EVA_19441 [gut metagenome]|uniref:Uncharacterized protein n=1 Tax=gut metagenome TaxID=749906 RepID=J9FS99_9ZZZZ
MPSSSTRPTATARVSSARWKLSRSNSPTWTSLWAMWLRARLPATSSTTVPTPSRWVSARAVSARPVSWQVWVCRSSRPSTMSI